MVRTLRTFLMLFAMATLISVTLFGCSSFSSPPVMSGTWRLTTDRVVVPDVDLTFESGQVRTIAYRLAGVSASTNPVAGSTVIDGDSIAIQVGWENNNLTFNGAFGADPNRADGTLDARIGSGVGKVEVLASKATLVRSN
jgi:hypothetical protein